MIVARIMPTESLFGAGARERAWCLRCGAQLIFTRAGEQTFACPECGLVCTIHPHCLVGAGDEPEENRENT